MAFDPVGGAVCTLFNEGTTEVFSPCGPIPSGALLRRVSVMLSSQVGSFGTMVLGLAQSPQANAAAMAASSGLVQHGNETPVHGKHPIVVRLGQSGFAGFDLWPGVGPTSGPTWVLVSLVSADPLDELHLTVSLEIVRLRGGGNPGKAEGSVGV